MARGVRSPLVLEVEAPGAVRVRQPVPPDLGLAPSEADGRLDASLLPRRRGRHVLPAAAVRVEGRLGLARVTSRRGGDAEVLVYPDLPAAHRLVTAVRQGRFRDPGLLTRGPLGLGTDFESIRDYQPDDDIRQVNWRASARVGRPMSNQYRVEQDRNVICCVDAGRLMSAPRGRRRHPPRRRPRRRRGRRSGGRRGRRPVRGAGLRRHREAACPAPAPGRAGRGGSPLRPGADARWKRTTRPPSAGSAEASAPWCWCSPTCWRRPRPGRWSRPSRCWPGGTWWWWPA